MTRTTNRIAGALIVAAAGLSFASVAQASEKTLFMEQSAKAPINVETESIAAARGYEGTNTGEGVNIGAERRMEQIAVTPAKPGMDKGR